MAIKAWPYGRKPGIAVAKETKSRLLTVWPLKLWGAAAPVAQIKKKRCKKDFQDKTTERNNLRHSVFSSQKSSHCQIVGVRWPPHWFTQAERYDGSVCTRWVSTDGKTSTFIYELFALATASWTFASPLNQLATNTRLLRSIFLSITAVGAELRRDGPCSAHHVPLLGDN